MECIYIAELNRNDIELIVTGEEARHLKVLNIRDGEEVMASNGKGIVCTGIAERRSKTEFRLTIMKFMENYGERSNKLGLALAILDSRDRFEFAVEKAVELGATHIYPLITKYTQKKNIDYERLLSKSVAALKQSKRSKLPEIAHPVKIESINDIFTGFDTIFLMDENGVPPPTGAGMKNILIIVGPEGGLTPEEIQALRSMSVMPISLGNRRLRAETAAIAALSVLSLV